MRIERKTAEREPGIGKGRKENPVLFLVIAGRSWERPLSCPLTLQMGMRPQGSCDLFKVTGHRRQGKPGHCQPFRTWLGPLSSGIQATAGLRGLKDHPLVLCGTMECGGQPYPNPGDLEASWASPPSPSPPNTLCVFFFN